MIVRFGFAITEQSTFRLPFPDRNTQSRTPNPSRSRITNARARRDGSALRPSPPCKLLPVPPVSKAVFKCQAERVTSHRSESQCRLCVVAEIEVPCRVLSGEITILQLRKSFRKDA